MLETFKTMLGTLLLLFRSHSRLQVEILALRQQLIVLRRTAPKRVRLRALDRLLFVLLYRLWNGVLDSIAIVQPDTIVRWHRRGFRALWRWKSRRRLGRPSIANDVRELIREISRAKSPRPFPGTGHLAISFATVTAPLVRSSSTGCRPWGSGIDQPAPRSPWQNAHVERLIGSIQRDCLDRLIIVDERHLRGVLRDYAVYYNWLRTHLSLNKDTPSGRPVQSDGVLHRLPHFGGLHHSFVRM